MYKANKGVVVVVVVEPRAHFLSTYHVTCFLNLYNLKFCNRFIHIYLASL